MRKLFKSPIGPFDEAAFALRYGLTADQFKAGLVGSEYVVAVFDAGIPLVTDDPPIFLPPPPPKTRRDFALEFIEKLRPNATAQEKMDLAISLLKVSAPRDAPEQ